MESKDKDFWLIVIQEKEIVVSLVSYSPGGIQVRGIGDKQGWSGTDEKELLSAVDISLTTCSETCHLTPDQEPDNIALILSPFWTDEHGEIIGSKANLLKKLCQQFDFKPLGFMVDDEALADAADQKGSLSNSFILIHLAATEFRLSLIHLGKVKARAKYSYTNDLSPKQIEDAISSLKTNITLPPQIVFWGRTNPILEDQMLNYSWVSKRSDLGFLHFPEIKILDDQEVFSTLSQIVTREMAQVPVTKNPPATSKKEKTISPESKLDSDTKIPDHQENHPPKVISSDEKTNFGFISEDIAAFKTTSQPDLLTTPPTPLVPSAPKLKKSFLPPLPKLKFPHFSLPSFIKKKPILYLLVLLSVLLVSLLFSWYYFLGADIKLYIKPEPIEFITQATFDPNAKDLDINKTIIPVKEFSFSLEKTQDQITTGEKTIGEKSRGEIKIQNRTDEKFDLPQGTVVISDGGLSFYLTSEVSIASKTPDFESGLDHWGETRAMIEAAQIGPEYNLNIPVRFTIKDYPPSSFVTTSTESFTGGYSKTVQSVSAKDHRDLKTNLLFQVEENLKDTISQKISSQDLLLNNSSQTEIENIEYSREIGEEATSVSATATVKVTVQLLEEAVQKQIIAGFLNPTLSSDLTINPNSVNFSLSPQEEIVITASAIPLLDTQDLAKKLLGLKEPAAFQLLQSLPRVYRYTLIYQPEMLNFLKILPRRIENIKIETSY